MSAEDVKPGGPLYLTAPAAQAEYAADVIKLSFQHNDLSNTV